MVRSARKALFRWKDFPPACEYCRQGKPSPDGSSVLCAEKGVMRKQSHCRRFRYDPLKRRPQRSPFLPEYDPEQFVL
ncbi:MAG: hypothetical protein LBQ33_01640 [Oscillospiraceae bacterium]|jgi:hypothetical protein|nr:hypothetical protein [Oscillospiraceae bacterium]